jgi:NAD(P)-dependent dehydrogenase (short-subunit alcohol dehydrogenase family)
MRDNQRRDMTVPALTGLMRDRGNMMRLQGKTALVTGASHGIGQATALRLAAEGADVAITFRGREDGAHATVAQIEALGRRALLHQAELSEPDACVRAVEDTLAALGQLDILVSNAGGSRNDALLRATLADWRYTLDLCVTAPFLCGQRAAQAMVERGAGGAIVNISSVHSTHAWPNDGAYGVAKAALNRLTESMALEWARFGIRVNGIAPGYIEVAVTEDEQARYAHEKQHSAPIIPLQRTGRPQEIAAAVAFLVSNDASYITGRTLFVDGGLLLPPVTTADYLRGDREGRGFSG